MFSYVYFSVCLCLYMPLHVCIISLYIYVFIDSCTWITVTESNDCIVASKHVLEAYRKWPDFVVTLWLHFWSFTPCGFQKPIAHRPWRQWRKAWSRRRPMTRKCQQWKPWGQWRKQWRRWRRWRRWNNRSSRWFQCWQRLGYLSTQVLQFMEEFVAVLRAVSRHGVQWGAWPVPRPQTCLKKIAECQFQTECIVLLSQWLTFLNFWGFHI